MRRDIQILFIGIVFILSAACAASYKAKPLPFKSPSSYPNATEAAGAIVGAEAFGFDIRKAGMLPVQVVFDNQDSGRSTCFLDFSTISVTTEAMSIKKVTS